MPHPRINTRVRGKYIKLGGYADAIDIKRKDWIEVSDIIGAKKNTDTQGDHIRIRLKGGRPDFVYRGKAIDYVKDKLTKEGIGD